jgi:hypothetical protein
MVYDVAKEMDSISGQDKGVHDILKQCWCIGAGKQQTRDEYVMQEMEKVSYSSIFLFFSSDYELFWIFF